MSHRRKKKEEKNDRKDTRANDPFSDVILSPNALVGITIEEDAQRSACITCPQLVTMSSPEGKLRYCIIENEYGGICPKTQEQAYLFWDVKAMNKELDHGLH